MPDLTHIILSLRGGCWTRLQDLVNHPDGKHQGGGFQNRKAKWRTAMDLANKSIALDADDIDWIKRQIANANNGGWEKKVEVIFAGQHPEFSRIPRKPRKKPEDRKKRKA